MKNKSVDFSNMLLGDPNWSEPIWKLSGFGSPKEASQYLIDNKTSIGIRLQKYHYEKDEE